MKLTGHRGAKDEWPENTLLGMKKAIEAGVKAIEIDIHKTKDNRLVVIHDSKMDRTTNISGKVSDLVFDEVRLADAGQGEQVPSLEEIIDLCKESKIELFIEAKVFNVENELQAIINLKSAYEFVYVISFDHRFLKAISNKDSKIKTGCLMVAAPIDPVSIVRTTGSKLLVISTDTVDETVAKLCHEANIKVAVWNANSSDQLNRMKEIGADYIMTDRPSEICPLVR